MADLDRLETMRIVEATGKYSAVVINSLRDPSMRRNALMLIDADIAQHRAAIAVAQRAKEEITSVIKAEKEAERQAAEEAANAT